MSAGLKANVDGSAAIQVGGTDAITFTSGGVASFVSNPALSAGTANGVVYLNGSKVATSGSGLVFDGTNLSINNGTSNAAKFRVYRSTSDTNYIELRTNGGDSVIVANGITGANGSLVFGRDANTGTYTESARIDSSGNFGIGTTSPVAKNHIKGTGTSGQVTASWMLENGSSGTAGMDITGAAGSSYLRLLYGAGPSTGTNTLSTGMSMVLEGASAGNVGIGTSSPGALFHANGTIRYTNRPAAGTITAIGYDANGDLKNSSSSLRYKYDIEDYGKGLAEVMQLRPVSFKFNGEERQNIGYIAEEVNALGLTEVMLYDEEQQPDGVLYANMVALLTKAIQEQQQMIETLQAKVAALEAK